jgi:hypothetical protein
LIEPAREIEVQTRAGDEQDMKQLGRKIEEI